MKCTRTKPEQHWRSVGIRAAKSGLRIEVALTGNASVDGWIHAGYALGEKHRAAKHRARSAAELAARTVELLGNATKSPIPFGVGSPQYSAAPEPPRT